MKKLDSPCVYIVGDHTGLAAILEWLADNCGVAGGDVVAVAADAGLKIQQEIEATKVPEMAYASFRQTVSEHDVVIVSSEDFAGIVAELIALGCHNVFDGHAILRRSDAVRRVLTKAQVYHLGANAPAISDQEQREFRRYSADPVTPRCIPGHLLFVVNSMPKSGTLWMIAMLEDILGVKARHQITVSHVRDIESDWPKPNNHGAVALVRDIRDVVVSWFHHLARLDLQNGFRAARYSNIEQFYFEYFIGQICGSERFYFGDFDRWLNYIGANSIPLIRYEDMIADTLSAISRVMTFWKVDVSETDLRDVVHSYAFENMQANAGDRDGYVSDMLRSGHLHQGSPGAWQEELSNRVADDIAVRFDDYQRRLNYN